MCSDFYYYPTAEDRVQWHRALAEMMRWLEEYEIKHVEFDRCIKAYSTMSSVWMELADKHSHTGYRAFA